jgi:hypothetical protein
MEPDVGGPYHIMYAIITETVESLGQLEDLGDQFYLVGSDVRELRLTHIIHAGFQPCLEMCISRKRDATGRTDNIHVIGPQSRCL